MRGLQQKSANQSSHIWQLHSKQQCPTLQLCQGRKLGTTEPNTKAFGGRAGVHLQSTAACGRALYCLQGVQAAQSLAVLEQSGAPRATSLQMQLTLNLAVNIEGVPER